MISARKGTGRNRSDDSHLDEGLGNAARETGWHLWMRETVHALRHTDIYRFGTWTELERLSEYPFAAGFTAPI